MLPLPPVKIDDVKSEAYASTIDIPVLEDPIPIEPGRASRFNRRHVILLGVGLVAIGATWAALNFPIQEVLLGNWQDQLAAIASATS